MTHYVGLDVSQKLTTICIVDDTGRRLWRDQCTSDPEQICQTVRRHAGEDARIGIETGPITPWLVHELRSRRLVSLALTPGMRGLHSRCKSTRPIRMMRRGRPRKLNPCGYPPERRPASTRSDSTGRSIDWMQRAEPDDKIRYASHQPDRSMTPPTGTRPAAQYSRNKAHPKGLPSFRPYMYPAGAGDQISRSARAELTHQSAI